MSDLTSRQVAWILGGALMTLATMPGETVFIARFNAALGTEFDLSHGAFGGLYTNSTLTSATGLKSGTGQFSFASFRTLSTSPVVWRSGNPNSAFSVRQVGMAASGKVAGRPRRPLGAARHSISGSNQISNEPRCLSAALGDRHSAIAGRGGTAVIPIRRNGRAWKEDGPAARARNEILRASRHFGRALWKRLTGYHARSRVEAQMRRLKSFGERIASRDPDRQAAEIHTRIALMNRFSALGRAEITRVA